MKCLWPRGRASAHPLKAEALLGWWQQCYYPWQGWSNETTWNLARGPGLDEAAADWADTDIFSAFLTSLLSVHSCSRAPTMLCSALKKADCQQCGVVQQELSMSYQGQKGPRSFFITFYHFLSLMWWLLAKCLATQIKKSLRTHQSSVQWEQPKFRGWTSVCI